MGKQHKHFWLFKANYSGKSNKKVCKVCGMEIMFSPSTKKTFYTYSVGK